MSTAVEAEIEEASVSGPREEGAEGEEEKGDTSGQPPHPPSDGSKDSNAAEESNELTVSASLSNSSSKADSNLNLESSDKRSLDSINLSGNKTKKDKTKIKVVQSRYKAAAAAAKSSNNNSNNNNNNSSGSSSQSRSWSNETLPARLVPAGKRLPPKTKPKRARADDTKTTATTTTTTTTATASCFQTPQLGGIGSATKSRVVKSIPAKPSKANRSILHSTALSTTLMGDVTSVKSGHNVLSSTLLCGVTPGGFKRTPAGPTLMELPDLSVINPEGNNSGNRTILSSVSEEPQMDIETTTTTTTTTTTATPEVTLEMLEQEYMRYLQWAYVDANSDVAFAAQLKEMQNQLVFLEELTSGKQQEVSELRQKTELIRHHQRAGKASETQTKLLQALVDNLPGCEEAEKTMERELEKKLHQVKMDNIFIPQDHVIYREELTGALNAQLSLLEELKGELGPRTQHNPATLKLLGDLQDITELVRRSEREMQQVAGLAVEDASHQLGTKPITLNDM